MDKYLTPTTVEDIDYLSSRLRKADKDECSAATGLPVRDALYTGYLAGDVTLTLRNSKGLRVGICGVVSSQTTKGAGVIWMTATDDIYQHQMTFLRKSKAALEYLSDGYLVLFNCVDARNHLHIKWLKWMGFTFIQKHEEYGAEQRPFYEFIRISKNVSTNSSRCRCKPSDAGNQGD
jgi:hypothetical protein